MGNNRQVGASSFDHLFGPKDSSSSSSTSSGIFGSIFPPPSKGTIYYGGFAVLPLAQKSEMTSENDSFPWFPWFLLPYLVAGASKATIKKGCSNFRCQLGGTLELRVTHAGNEKYVNPDNATPKAKGESRGISGKGQSSVYQNETPEPCNFSSSIYYGGQENYSPRTKNSESQHVFKKDYEKDDPNGNDPDSASRGNWWQGSLYY
ncbi:hypothetical protein OIU78_006469 [Salix suchowensis]|nr:hypothetical protein OIU78_006469 [Salix suchowensis]